MILITNQVRKAVGSEQTCEQLPQGTATIDSPLKFRDNSPPPTTPSPFSSCLHPSVRSGAIYASSFNKHFSLMCCHYLSLDNKSFQHAVAGAKRQTVNICPGVCCIFIFCWLFIWLFFHSHFHSHLRRSSWRKINYRRAESPLRSAAEIKLSHTRQHKHISLIHTHTHLFTCFGVLINFRWIFYALAVKMCTDKTSEKCPQK